VTSWTRSARAGPQPAHRVIGTVRETGKADDLVGRYPEIFHVEVLDVTDLAPVRELVDQSFVRFERIEPSSATPATACSFGAAEELTDSQVEKLLATNLAGPIQLIRAARPHLLELLEQKKQKGGRVSQISSYGGQVAIAGNSLYHATKWGI
jgi:NAD(P)-dependent dehydrogenase (short-subunit alcohol dehydrogenase family)